MKSKTSTFWTCCGFRRRTVTNKLMAIVLQVVIVVIVWHIVKRSERNADCDDKSMERNTDESAVTGLQSGQYTEGTSNLRVSDIASTLPSSDTDGKTNRKNILKIDIFLRDADRGILVRYPKGTPFLLETGTIVETGKSDSMSEFYYDNSFEEKDLGFGEEKLNDVVDTSSGKRKGGDNQLPEDENSLEGNGNPSFRIQNALVNGKSATGNNDNIKYQSSFKIDSKLGIPGSQQIDQNRIRPGTNEMIDTMNQNSADTQLDFKQHSDTQQVQGPHVIQKLFQNLNVQKGMPGLSNQQQDSETQQMNEANDHITTTQMTTTTSTENYYDTGVVNTVAKVEKTLYTIGFLDRVKMFKSQFYGKSQESPSLQSATQYLINNPNLCENLDNIDLLILIHSIPQSDEQRDRIRSTFVQRDLFKPYSIVYVFLVGKTNSPNFQSNLNSDAEKFCDIVQGDFDDRPAFRTQKGLMGMEWTLSFCPKAKFILKIDEDVFVDTQKLLSGLIPTINQVIDKRAMLCSFSTDAPIPRSGPNAISPDIFPNSSKLRPFCKGFAVLMTSATVSSLVAASKHVPICPLDDMYLYGVLPFIAGGIEVYDLGNKRAFHDFGMAVVTCYRELRDRCQYVITKAFSSRFTALWEIVKSSIEKGSSERHFMGQSMWDVASWRRQF